MEINAAHSIVECGVIEALPVLRAKISNSNPEVQEAFTKAIEALEARRSAQTSRGDARLDRSTTIDYGCDGSRSRRPFSTGERRLYKSSLKNMFDRIQK